MVIKPLGNENKFFFVCNHTKVSDGINDNSEIFFSDRGFPALDGESFFNRTMPTRWQA
jgi:hypothetical protein